MEKENSLHHRTFKRRSKKMNKKKKQSFIKEYLGKDKIAGRPIRLNRVILEPNSKGYAELFFWGDVHYGHPQCQINEAMRMLNWAVSKGMYILLMGDLLESGTRESVSDSVYQQHLNPQDQMEEMIELLEPIVKSGLVIGMHEGNHENRITRMTSINVTKIMARILGIPYLGYSCWTQLKVGKQHYSMYSTHGTGGSKFKHTKMKSAMDIAHWIEADIIAKAHMHSLGNETIIKQSVDYRNKVVVERKCHVILTGSYMSWDKSYAQMMEMPITQLGSPIVKIFATRKDIYCSL